MAVRYGLRAIPPALRAIAEQGHADLCPANMSRISVGMASCGQAAGAAPWAARLAARPDFVNRVIVRNVGCIGACYAEPLVDVRTPDGLHHIFGEVSSEVHWPIIRTAQQRSMQQGAWLVLRERCPGLLTGFEDLETVKAPRAAFAAFFEHQKRRITGNCGLIDPLSLPEYVATGGYFALAKALLERTPDDIIAEITASGLRGRGGGGFYTGRKWETAAASRDPRRFVIANADEGDPGAYMDRTLMESDPHRVLEGIILAAYACGAGEAYIFVRHEYPLAVARLRRAVGDARAAGLLGEEILGTNFSLKVGIIQSGGAFVCGEESSLLQVMQGRRGEPWPRPPYPAQQGFYGHPTVINNVETLANVPWIIARGAAAFREAGNADSPGTKIFCLTGDIPNTGFIEVPLGDGARTVVERIGGASPDEVKALQIGGPSGGIVPYTDFALDYSSLSTAGAMIGSGGLVVLNHSRCVVDLARHLSSFMADESCGQCLFCRDGLARITGLLEELTSGKGAPGLIDELAELSRAVADLSLCALGRTAINPLLTTIRHFRSECEAHLAGICPALSCKPLIRFEIIPSRCTDCRGCLDCPVQAISYQAGKGPLGYTFDHEKCTRCRICAEICPHYAIRAVSGGDRL
ncbi:NADH-ubiquinone oxidoreductase-F iron-sulfur binding region domain-containing protein [Anaeroselena agilis]|uniref:NADH-ubiquinone oxidoreductase-F iron-sulfur binding region domain-containing protein n=1 Tax=Anaeroselena agilis TaxID=3063788 RepID=A0ABU3P2L9_9FIRM|nr:NADH-ubiquinone oxidoreductase-F iron-sulfur binding region domain-containing protein [Selenomonadales bacterium 4137-cl]